MRCILCSVSGTDCNQERFQHAAPCVRPAHNRIDPEAAESPLLAKRGAHGIGEVAPRYGSGLVTAHAVCQEGH